MRFRPNRRPRRLLGPRGGPAGRPAGRRIPSRLNLPQTQISPARSGADPVKMAVTVGFEPTVGGYPTQLFESCTFGRSDTSPPTSLRHVGGCCESSPLPRSQPSSIAPRITSTTRSGSSIPTANTYVAVKPMPASDSAIPARSAGVDSGVIATIAVFSMSS